MKVALCTSHGVQYLGFWKTDKILCEISKTTSGEKKHI